MTTVKNANSMLSTKDYSKTQENHINFERFISMLGEYLLRVTRFENKDV